MYTMKKYASFFLALCLVLSLAACGKEAPAPAPAPVVTAIPVPVPTPEATEAPAPVETAAPAPAAWETLYSSFLTANYQTLAEACYGFVAGVGFIDLDLDTVPELLVFDAGASSSMGVQFFDIVNGKVECVSASSVAVGDAFGGEYYDPRLNVNTTAFEAFRLKEGPDGALYFEVTSHNGAEDLRYSELIRFGKNAAGVLTLQTLACRQTSVDPATQTELYTVCTVGDQPIDSSTYDAILAEAGRAIDYGYEAGGVFLWEDKGYGQDILGFNAMLEAAVAKYVPAL